MRLVHWGPKRARGTTRPLDDHRARGFPAHRALLARTLVAPLAPGRKPDVIYVALHADAVTERAWTARETRAQAERAVADLLAHVDAVTGLPWALEADLLVSAAEEMAIYSLFEGGVSSRQAQLAWRRWKDEQPYGPVTGPRDAVTEAKRAAVRERVLRAEWAQAWAVWAARARVRGDDPLERALR
ncbi:hypothetical protein EV189_2454 [Motilibacter rhizosphaerae]|uniref:Uncharacterized protein n=1 Tax=Motilibacter rhizosphaerae TaxID=598652 RepID=A0A4Q7NPL8_9ACTN|nr:hypothetical protein [Motilibacter rhizosphaerae]RZS87032.1 hypothetical protein EV189_2454 [Motilibacter rhizosphaerae]